MPPYRHIGQLRDASHDEGFHHFFANVTKNRASEQTEGCATVVFVDESIEVVA